MWGEAELIRIGVGGMRWVINDLSALQALAITALEEGFVDAEREGDAA